MFYPDQTLDGLARNVSFFLRSGLIDAFDVNHYGHELMLFPGTPLRSLYEQRCGHPFDTDMLPDTDSLFVDPAVLKVKQEFRGKYLERYGTPTHTLRDELRTVARAAQDDRTRAVLRQHEMRLRHHPYEVLEGLVRSFGQSRQVYSRIDDDLKQAAAALRHAEGRSS